MSGNTRRSSCIVKYVLSFHSYSCKSNFATLKLEELSSWSYSFAVRDLTIGNNYRVSWLNFLVWVRAQGQWARLLSQARTFPTHPLRFLILCSFNRELDCDLCPKDRIFSKNYLLLLFRCLTSKQCTALKPTASSPTCSPQLTPPGITQVSHRWVRCSFLFGSHEMICGLLDLVRDRLVPLIELVL